MTLRYCDKCGGSLNQRWDRITAGECEFLVEFRKLVIRNNKNLIHVPTEMGLSNVEYSDYQKLRYHGLLAKRKEDGRYKKGWWVLTHRGSLFAKGEIKIPERVRVFRNRITAYSEEEVYIHDVTMKYPKWDAEAEIEFEPATTEIIEESNAIRVKKALKKGRKKVKNPCLICGLPMKFTLDTKFNEATQTFSAPVKKFYCVNCQKGS